MSACSELAVRLCVLRDVAMSLAFVLEMILELQRAAILKSIASEYHCGIGGPCLPIIRAICAYWRSSRSLSILQGRYVDLLRGSGYRFSMIGKLEFFAVGATGFAGVKAKFCAWAATIESPITAFLATYHVVRKAISSIRSSHGLLRA